MAIYNRQWLRDMITSYLHDDSVTVTDLDVWIDLGAVQIGETVSCYEMENQLLKQAGLDYVDLAPNVKEVLGVTWQSASGQDLHLRSFDKFAADNYRGDGSPAGYLLRTRRIEFVPYQEGTYKVDCLEVQEIPEDPQAQMDMLTAYPTLFLAAALAEAYDWKQNAEMAVRYEGKYLSRAGQITAAYLRGRVGDSPAMRAR